jgi:hypothetical protein
MPYRHAFSGNIPYPRMRWALLALLLPLAFPVPAEAAEGFSYDLRLQVNDQPVAFHIPWRCKIGLEGPNFGPGGLLRSVMKPTVSDVWVARTISTGAVLFTKLRTYCQDAPDYDPLPLYIVDSPTHPTLLQMFTRDRQIGLGYTVHVVASSIVRLSKAELDYSTSARERELMKSVRDSCSGYQSVLAITYPESTWDASEDLRQQFSRLATVTLGPFQHLQALDMKPRLQISLVRDGDAWRLPAQAPSENRADVYFPLQGPPQTTDKLRADGLLRPAPPVTVVIGGVGIPLDRDTQPVYDPQRRWFMRLLNEKMDCWTFR